MLKYLSGMFILILLLMACKNNPAPANNANGMDSAKVDTTAKKDTLAARLWIIKDSSMYSKTFLKGLYDNPDSVSLVDNYIVDKHDTIYFPDYFDGNRQTVFEGVKDSTDYKLQVFNCTYTKIQFIFSATKNSKLVQHYYGEAEISPRFFTANDSDINDADSSRYRVDKYKGENEKYVYELSLGAKGDKLQGRFYAHAKDSVKNQNFNVCPVLSSDIKYVPKHRH